jgi:hypothetical protein
LDVTTIFSICSHEGASAVRLAKVAVMLLTGIAWGGVASGGERPSHTKPERRAFVSFAARELGCHDPKRTNGRTKFWFTLDCDYRKAGLHWLEFGTSPDQGRVNAVDTVVVGAHGVPAWTEYARHRAMRFPRSAVTITAGLKKSMITMCFIQMD